MDNTYTLRIAVCEDEPADMARLVKHIESSGVRSEILCFESGEAFLNSFRAGRYDVIFMDIYMGGEMGVEVAGKIRKVDKFVTLVFTTNSLDHTLESYRLKAVGYLEKPLSAEDVKEALVLTRSKLNTRVTASIAMEGGKKTDVPLDEIIFLEQQGHVIAIHTVSSGLLTASRSAAMDELEKSLPSPPFLRCHRSFIVNLDYVRRIDRKTHSFTMMNGGRVDINQRLRLGKFEEELHLWMTEKAGRDDI